NRILIYKVAIEIYKVAIETGTVRGLQACGLLRMAFPSTTEGFDQAYARADIEIDRLCQRELIRKERLLSDDDHKVVHQAIFVLGLSVAKIVLRCFDGGTQADNLV